MPVRIANDELLPVEFYEVRLDSNSPFFSSIEGNAYDTDSAPEFNQIIDIVYVSAGDGRTMIASPGALADADIYGENALNWGDITTYFRITELSSDDFDGLVDYRLLDYYFNKSDEVELPEPFEDGTHLFYPGQGELTEGTIVAFYGAYGNTGLMRITSLDGEQITFDVKVQPSE